MKLRKLFSLLLCLQILLSNQISNIKEINQRQLVEKESILPYKTYNLDSSTIPFWKNSIMYNESILFVRKNSLAPLLYKPTSIISITSYDGTITYSPRNDYNVVDGKIYLTKNTRIPFFTEEEYYPKQQSTSTLDVLILNTNS